MQDMDTEQARREALAKRKAAKPCKVCKRPTLAKNRICDRHYQ
jgi:hypothetical protein